MSRPPEAELLLWLLSASLSTRLTQDVPLASPETAFPGQDRPWLRHGTALPFPGLGTETPAVTIRALARQDRQNAAAHTHRGRRGLGPHLQRGFRPGAQPLEQTCVLLSYGATALESALDLW